MHATATVQNSDPGTTRKIRRCDNGQDVFEVRIINDLLLNHFNAFAKKFS